MADAWLVPVKKCLAGILVIALASCASPGKNETSDKIPSPSAMWGSATAVTLPLDTISLDGRLVFYFVELSINGEKGRFMVDSGSNVSWFTQEFARTIREKSPSAAGHRMKVIGVGGTRRQDTTVVDSVDLGFASLHNVLFACGDVLGLINRGLVAKKEPPLAGILGLDLLVPLGASLDLRKSTITFQKPGT
jgi:Aspartyl protease